jgi:hypothetical protein
VASASACSAACSAAFSSRSRATSAPPAPPPPASAPPAGLRSAWGAAGAAQRLRAGSGAHPCRVKGRHSAPPAGRLRLVLELVHGEGVVRQHRQHVGVIGPGEGPLAAELLQLLQRAAAVLHLAADEVDALDGAEVVERQLRPEGARQCGGSVSGHRQRHQPARRRQRLRW